MTEYFAKDVTPQSNDEGGRCYYHVYILESLSDPGHFYVGITQEMKKRLAEHNAGKCIHTRKLLPWKISSVVTFSDSKKAYSFEKYLKSGSGRAFSKKHF